MSALPPKADIGTQSRNVRYVPKADMRDPAKTAYLVPLGVALVHQRDNVARAQYAREGAVVVGHHFFLVFRRIKCRIAGRFVGEAVDGVMHALFPRAPAAPRFLAFENP